MSNQKLITTEGIKKIATNIYLTGYDQGYHETHDENDLKAFEVFWDSSNQNTWKEQFEAILSEVCQGAYAAGAMNVIDDIQGYENESRERFFYTSEGEREEMLLKKYSKTENQTDAAGNCSICGMPENMRDSDHWKESNHPIIEKNRT